MFYKMNYFRVRAKQGYSTYVVNAHSDTKELEIKKREIFQKRCALRYMDSLHVGVCTVWVCVRLCMCVLSVCFTVAHNAHIIPIHKENTKSTLCPIAIYAKIYLFKPNSA